MGTPLLDLVGDGGLRTGPGLGSEAVGRDRCRVLLALDNLAHPIPHKREGAPKAMKPARKPLPSLPPHGQAAWFQRNVHWAATPALDVVGSPCSAAGAVASGMSSELCDFSHPWFTHSSQGARVRGPQTATDLCICPVHLTIMDPQGTGRQRHDLSPCPKSSDGLSQYRSSILQYAAECHMHYIV